MTSALARREPAEQRLLRVRNGLCNWVQGWEAGLEADCFSKREGADRKQHEANNLQRNESFPAKNQRQHPCERIQEKTFRQSAQRGGGGVGCTYKNGTQRVRDDAMASSEDFGDLDAKEIKKTDRNPTRNDVRLHDGSERRRGAGKCGKRACW